MPKLPSIAGARAASFWRLPVVLIALLALLALTPFPTLAATPQPAQQDPPVGYLPIARTPGGPLATVASPDSSVAVRIIGTRAGGGGGLLRFEIHHGARPLVTSGQLAVVANGYDPATLFTPLFTAATEYTLVSVTSRIVREEYTLAVSERSQIPNRYNEVTLALKTSVPPERRLNLVVRAFDEGVALRYVVPAQAGVERVRFVQEGTQFLFPAGTAAWEQRPLGSVGWSEGVYSRVPVEQLSAQMPLPLTLDFGGEYGALFEAAVDNFARSSLKRVTGATSGVALYLEGPSEDALPYATPWRTLMVADSAGGLIEQNYLLYNLAEPTRYSAVQVAEFARMPGTAMRIFPDANGVFWTETAKQVVDFADARDIDYVAFDAGWYGPEFAPEADPTKEGTGNLSIATVSAYAASKGVGVILYVNQVHLDANIDEILGIYQSWGVKGIKLGFVDGTSKAGINLIHYSVEQAAQYGMFVDVHDAYRPSGMTRTYPNLFTQEGVAGAEHGLNADHTTQLPFTRFIIGAADYTLPYYWGSLPTTRGHQLGLAILFYSPLNFVLWYDLPAQYDASPGADFLASVPTTWDETRVLSGAPAESVAMARRSGSSWYVGAITNQSARSLPVTLDFLQAGVTYTARIYSESTRNVVTVQDRSVVRGDQIQLNLLASGGAAIRLTPNP